jgi:hypothetical protein
VPEATVDKHDQASCSEHNVGTAAYTRQNGTVDAISQPAGMQ